MHTVHGADLACQVCHSVSYSNCDGCHVAISSKTGNPFFETQGTYMTFVIGLNNLRSFDRPYKYVPVRHVPIAPTSYEYYGDNLLPNFNSLPTWVYTTPHNIQLKTPQAETCNACHGNPDLFLTADKVQPAELEANLPVIVPEVPPALPGE
jgi:thiosulfate/3-mercaptopyruvate sulfurtransferase